MAITVICSNCSRQYRVRDERAGAEFRCRSCQAKISVPLPVNVSAGQPPTTRSRRTPARFRQPAWLVGAGVITVLVVTVAFVFLPAKPEAPERAADSNGSGPRQQETSLASADSSGRELSMDDGAAASSHRGGDQTSATVTESGESAAASDSDVSEIIFPPSRSVSQPSADSAAVADSEQMERRPEKPAQVVQPAELTGPPKGEPAGDEEFVGPFASWFDLKRDFGALGDGQADDTAALQRALDELAQGDNRRGENRCVLFLPAGTYRITSGLTMVNRVGLGVIGEHPERTKILWDGPGGDGVCMLHCNGVHHSRFGRITWDGAGKDVTAVAHEWDGKSGSGATYLEHSDEVFQDMTFGIRAGIQMLDSEVAVTRCRFLRASDSGVRLQSFNALDWWFWDCEFTDCQTGLRNEPGGGHFHVYRCLFQRSRSADLHVGHTSYFGIRHNVSVGSNNFLYCEFRTSRAAICLQNNRVIDAGDARTILVNNMGPLVLIDNTFITGPQPENRPVIAMNVKSPQDFDLISIGNRYSYPRLNVQGRHFAMDESVFQPKPIDLKIPKLPGTPENRNRHVIEVPPGASGEEIQSAINKACEFAGQRPVVHLPAGLYPVHKPIQIPAYADVQLAGDGNFTILRWVGESSGPVVDLHGPSHATLRNLYIQSSEKVATKVKQAIGIQLSNCDQEGSRVFGDQLAVGRGETGVLVDRLNHTRIALQSSGAGHQDVGIQVIGGSLAGTRKEGQGGCWIFGGAGSENQLSFDVRSHGRLYVQDHWYEGTLKGMLHLTDSGRFTFSGGHMAPQKNAREPDLEYDGVHVDSFDGRVTLLTTGFNKTRVRVSSSGVRTEALLLGCNTSQFSGPEFVRADRSVVKCALLGCGGISKEKQGQGVLIENQGLDLLPGQKAGQFMPAEREARFIREMLEPARSAIPQYLTPIPWDATDVRLFRVSIRDSTTGLHLTPE